MSVTNATRGTLLGDRVRLANRWWTRLRGLLGARSLEAGDGLLLTPCPSVHTVGMRFSIDVALLDREGRVVALHPALPPNRFTRPAPSALHTLELPAGGLGRTEVGDRLVWGPAPGG